LDGEGWRLVLLNDLISAGGHEMLKRHNGSLMETLSDLFPGIHFPKKSFLDQENYWKQFIKHRKFLDMLAKFKNFSPLETEKWYTIQRKDISSVGGINITKYYKDSHVNTIMEVYPDLPLQRERFWANNDDWKETSVQREFFDNLAKSKNFTPLDPDKWYSVTRVDVITAGGGGLLKYHNQSHIKAIVNIYPELNLQLRKFPSYKEIKWNNSGKRREFFEKIAKCKNFDPLETEKWYLITRKDVIHAGGITVVNYYKGSYISALVNLFPELKLKKEKFLNYRGR